MTMTRRQVSPLVWLALAALAFAIAMLSLAPPSRHALERHGANAWAVTARFRQVPPDDDDVWQSECPDGRRYTIRQLPGGEAWDVSIDTRTGSHNVTRLTVTDAAWVARKLAWCPGD